MPTNATFQMSLAVSQSGTNGFSSGPYWDGTIMHSLVFGDGTTANNFDRPYMAERTVASGANDDIDLAGVLSDALGTTITAAELVGLVIINKQKDGTANTTSLTVGGSASNPVTAFFTGTNPAVRNIGPGGVFMLISPDATGLGSVAAGTGDILRITNGSGATNKYQIAILARSA